MGKTSLFNTILGEMRCLTNRAKMAQYVSDEVNKLNFKYDGDIENELIADPKFDPELPHIYIDGSIAYFA